MSIGNSLVAALLLWPTLVWAHAFNGVSGTNGNGLSIPHRPFQNIAPTSINPAPSGPPVSTALLHFDGTNGSTTITDSGPNHLNFYVSGTGPALNTSKFKFGTSSIHNAATTGYVTVDGAPLSFHTGDFTIDFWLWTVTPNSGQFQVFTFGQAAGSTTVMFLYQSPNMLFYSPTFGTAASGAFSDNTWHHLALTRASGQSRLFIDGVQQGSTYTDTNNYVDAATANPSLLSNNNAYMDELRVIVGTAAWTSNFTPPTSPYTQ